MEGAGGKTRRVPPPRGVGVPRGRSARGARRAPASGLQDRAARRPRGRAVSSRGRDLAARMVSRDGCAARSRRRPRGDRARDCRDGDRARIVPPRVASILHRGVRGADRTYGPRRADTRVNAPLKLLMPLRVPELAPSLGRIIVPRRLLPPWVPLDDIREELATRVLELGAEGRAATVRRSILETTGRGAWAVAWDNAVRRAALRVADALDAETMRAARRCRRPPRRLRRHLLNNAEKRAIVARLGTGAGAFVAALDELEAAAGRVADATVLDKDAYAAWQEALRTVARRLEAAWLALENEVEAEQRRWAPEIDAIAAWRPPLWPVFVVWIPLAVLLVWLGLIVGGYVAAPPWLAAQLGF